MSRVWGRHSPTSTTGACGAISICEIVATGRYLLFTFPRSLKIFISKRSPIGQSREVHSVSCLVGSPFTPDRVPAPVLQRRCQARPQFCEVMALYPVRTADEVVKVRMKNCEPVVRLQVSQKEKGSTAPKDFVVGGWRQNGLVKLRSGCFKRQKIYFIVSYIKYYCQYRKFCKTQINIDRNREFRQRNHLHVEVYHTIL